MEPKRALIWIALAGQVAGVTLGTGLPPAAQLGSASLATFLLGIRRRPALRLAGLLGVAFSVGAFSADLRAGPTAVEALGAQVPRCEVVGRVLESGGGLGTLVAAEAVACDGFAAIEHAGIVVVDAASLDAGGMVSLSGYLLPLGHDGFEGARRRLGAGAWMADPEIRPLAPPEGAFALAASLRSSLRGAVGGLEPDEAALLEGLTIGRTDNMTDSDSEAFRRSGLSHLVAVSGSNVALVVGAVVVAGARLSLWMRVMLAAAALGLYVVVVGPEPSVLRAAVMGAIALVALGYGARAQPLNTLGLALIVLLVFRPGLASSVGLHLSAAAAAGIVLWSGWIGEFASRLPRPLALGLGATVAAQIAVAPILVGVFGQLSVVAPPANLLAMPAVAPSTILGLAAAVAGLAGEPAGHAVAALAAPFARWILWVGHTFGERSWAALELDPKWGFALAVPVCAFAVAALRNQ